MVLRLIGVKTQVLQVGEDARIAAHQHLQHLILRLTDGIFAQCLAADVDLDARLGVLFVLKMDITRLREQV